MRWPALWSFLLLALIGLSGRSLADGPGLTVDQAACEYSAAKYDAFGRMTSWTDGTSTETHSYRGAGWERASTTSGGVTTSYLYDGNDVVGDLAGGAFTRQYVTPFLDENLSMTVIGGEQAGTYYYHRDGVGSVRGLTDSSQVVKNRYAFTAFGEPYKPGVPAGLTPPTSETAGLEQRYQFQGREASGNAGAPMFYRNRMYSAGLGRFGRRDPVLGGDYLYNAYGFPGANGVMGLDPFGDRDWSIAEVEQFLRIQIERGRSVEGMVPGAKRHDRQRSPEELSKYMTVSVPSKQGNVMYLLPKEQVVSSTGTFSAKVGSESRRLKYEAPFFAAKMFEQEFLGEWGAKARALPKQQPGGVAYYMDWSRMNDPKFWKEYHERIKEVGICPQPDDMYAAAKAKADEASRETDPVLKAAAWAGAIGFGILTLVECVDVIPDPTDQATRRLGKEAEEQAARQATRQAEERATRQGIGEVPGATRPMRPPNSPVYSVAVEAELKPGTLIASDAVQFRQANRKLYEQLQADPAWAARLEAEFPGIKAHVTPGPRGGQPFNTPPPGFTWHHHPDRPGVLQLVPTEQHQAAGAIQGSLHPQGSGGRSNWGGGTENR